MHLLTWRGTIVCLSRETGSLSHECLPLRERTLEPFDVNIPTNPNGAIIQHPILGRLQLLSSGEMNCFRLLHTDGKLYAQPQDSQILYGYEAEDANDTFMLISSSQLSDINFILTRRWISCSDRRVISRTRVSLASGFTLRIGACTVSLAASFSELVSDRSDNGYPVYLKGGNSDKPIEVVLAEPRGSALLTTVKFVTQSRRLSEILYIASHRQTLGLEPTQDQFESGASFIRDNGGASGLEDLLESLGPVSSRKNTTSDDDGGAGHLNRSLPCPVISLGTGCVVACALKQIDDARAPMPFDWLTSTPAMIKHCIETDFSFLLDRRHYKSLEGWRELGQPENGCDHLFYKQNFGVCRVFNHSDPTRQSDFRYLETCVDRFRDLMASDTPKLFIQCGKPHDDSDQFFDAMADLIDAKTAEASYLQVDVVIYDRRLIAPQLFTTKRRGRHHLVRIQPTSKLGGESFDAEVDNLVFRWLIDAHSKACSTHLIKRDALHAAMVTAFYDFDKDIPAPAEAQIRSSGPDVLRWANSVVARFCKSLNLYSNIRVGSFESTNLSQQTNQNICVAEVSGDNALILFPANKPLSRVVLNRLLTPIYLLDSMLSGALSPSAQFLIELGDHASYDCMAFCNNTDLGCLVPDPDFISSSGYSETRKLVKEKGREWSARLPVVFWRGATTGHRTKPPPDSIETDDFTWLPRLDMCRRLRDSGLAAHCDVGITSIVQIEERYLHERIATSQLCKPKVARETFLYYKYTIVIDGNSNAWSAMFCALLSGLCVLLVASVANFRQWYYGRLRPWEHYVPVSADLHDLEERISWVLANDASAEAIGKDGQKLAQAMTFETEVEETTNRLREWFSNSTPLTFDIRRLDHRRSPSELGWILGHVQDRGDTAAMIGDWVGQPGSGKCLEGIQIMLPPTMPRSSITYSIVLDEKRISDAVQSGHYAGTRGENTPIYGIVVTADDALADYNIEYESSFVDGSRLGPLIPGAICAAVSNSPMEAFRLSILPRLWT